MMGGSRAHRRGPTAETRPMVRERVDDMPRRLAHRDRMGLPPRLDAHCPRPGQGAGPDPAGVWCAPARGQGQDHAGRLGCWQPDAGDRAPGR